MKILLIDDDNNILELLALVLENTFKIELIDRCLTPQNATEKLTFQNYDLIICDYEMQPHGNGDIVFDFVLSNSIQSKFILFTSLESDTIEMLKAPEFKAQQFAYLQKPMKHKEFKVFVKDLLQREDEQLSESNYCAIRIHNFLRFDFTKCPVFVKISDKKYIKILNDNEQYDVTFIDKYIAKGVDFFYISQDDYDNFLVNFGKTDFLSNTTPENFLAEARKTHRYLGTLMSGIGISDYVVSQAENISQKILLEAVKENSFLKMLEELINSKDYSYDHTYLITCFCTHICKELQLSNQILERLAFTSLIHDIGIRKGDVCYVHDIKPMEIAKLSEDDRREIKNHHHCLDKIDNLPDITDDVRNILKYHHLFDDKYLYNLKFQMDRLNTTVAIFLVVHALTNQLFLHNFDPSRKRDILTLLKFKFKTPNFDKIIKTLENVLLKE